MDIKNRFKDHIMDIKGQISIEFIFLVGIILIITVGFTSYIGEDLELIQVMSCARSGAIQGANLDSFSIYPQDSFENNVEKHSRLLSPSHVKIISIKYKKLKFNPHYNKIKIKLIIIASCPIS